MMTFIKKDPRMLVQLVIRFSVTSEFDYSVLKVIEFKPFFLFFLNFLLPVPVAM